LLSQVLKMTTGYEMNALSGRANGAVSARSLVEAAYGAVRQDILSGDLAPGTKLMVELLKERYNVGAGTLREALIRLVGEALVISEEQRGFRVASISIEDLADLTRNRVFVEAEALRQAIELGDDSWEADIVAAYHHLSKVEERLGATPETQSDDFEYRNRNFHRALIAACPSRWLHHFHGILFQQSERYRRIALTSRPVRRDVHAEHEGLMKAALARDSKLACRLASEHIERTLDVLGKVLAAAAKK
jgi:DNA-binding GntR family transcriptional regulator